MYRIRARVRCRSPRRARTPLILISEPRSYGGIFERGAREYTLDDFYSLQLDKLDRYTCLKESGVVISAEGDDESSDEDDDDDEEGDDDEDDDEEEGDEGDDAEVEVEEKAAGKRNKSKGKGKPEVQEEPEEEAQVEVDSETDTKVVEILSSYSFV